MVNPILKKTFDDFASVFTAAPEDKLRAFDITIPTLIDLWTVRWGNEWVSGNEIKKDPYWNMQLLRLLNKELVEHLYLMDEQDTKYKLKEELNAD